MFRAKIWKIASNIFHQNSQFSYLTVKETVRAKPVGSKIVVKGWVQAIRKHKDLYFVDLIDGTCLERLQIVIQDHDRCPTYGSSIKVEGSLAESTHEGQDVELVAESWSTYGSSKPDYPFEYRVKYSPEYVRQFPHLRQKTRKMSSILRVRNNAAMALHEFFQTEGFCFTHTPIITRNDCEGAGEVFSVELKKSKTVNHVTHAGTSSSLNEARKVKQTAAPKEEEPKEFFNGPTYLTVSGQLHLEAMACGLSRVYNFGPVFRAENSHSRQHVSEFHMVEAEIEFLETVEELIKFVEKCIKHVAKSVLDNCYPEVCFLYETLNNNQEKYLKKIINEPFVVMTYKEAITVLQAHKKRLKVPKFGDDLTTEHKDFLVKYYQNIPVFITMFPSCLKPFYMKKDKYTKEAYCFDLFASYGGEICGGSLREDDEQILKTHPIFENGSLSWYLDLRRYGGAPHGGFGIGFDRLLQSILGISNIRDIIPFPRRKHDCKC